MSTLTCLFLDRDGCLVEDRHYLSNPDDLRLIPGAAAALRQAAARGIRLVVVTNQSGIGRGYFTEADHAACARRLEAMLEAEGVVLAGQHHCPHAPSAHCACRKPAQGLFLQARAQLGMDPAGCVMIGDKISDMRFGQTCGMAASLLVATGHGASQAAALGLPPLAEREPWRELTGAHPRLLARDLPVAIHWLLERHAAAPESPLSVALASSSRS